MGKKENAQWVLVGKREGKRTIGRFRRRWEVINNVKGKAKPLRA
jgi:hypothetical protein